MKQLPNLVPLVSVELRSIVGVRSGGNANDKTTLFLKKDNPRQRLWKDGDAVVFEKGGDDSTPGLQQMFPWAAVMTASVDHEAMGAHSVMTKAGAK